MSQQVDLLLKGLMVVILVTLSFLIFGLGVFLWNGYQESRMCGRWDTKLIHQEAWTQWVNNGKTMTPIYHEAADVWKRVCVEPRG